jgi:hypothetical protein
LGGFQFFQFIFLLPFLPASRSCCYNIGSA